MGCVSSSATADSAQQPSPSRGPHGQGRPPAQDWRASSGPTRPSQPVEAPPRTTFTSQAELSAQREEFWSSRVGGDPMVWMTLRSAADASINSDVATSEAILMASGVNAPGGSLEVCYDERGHEYRIPAFCFSPSSGLIVTKSELIPATDLEEVPTRAGPPGGTLHLKVKINPGDHLLLIDAFENDTVSMLKHQIFEKSIEANGKTEAGTKPVPVCTIARQRMILLGKELKNERQLLVDAKMEEGKVVQVFLKPLSK